MWTVPNNLDIFPCVQDMMVSDSELNSQASLLASRYMWRSKHDNKPDSPWYGAKLKDAVGVNLATLNKEHNP